MYKKTLKKLLSIKKAEDQSNLHNVKINPDHGKKIADAYEQMEHNPNHPEVKSAYNSLIQETKSQYKDLLDKGYKFSRIEEGMDSPYKNSKDMYKDIEENKHLWYFPTDQGFGTGNKDFSDHPMLQPTEYKHDGKTLLANDLFRKVHDVNGHHLGGKSGFGPAGEHKAYLQHKTMYSPEAQKALATETKGQNNFVNFGPHGENNRKNPKETVYADQKAGLLPDHILEGEWHK